MGIAHLIPSAIYFFVILGIMVLVHEFGHFIVAKLCGVRVETFSIGFGKRLAGFRRGDTDYRLSLLPLGGYVKMAGEFTGESNTATGAPDEFPSRPRWQRVLIALAGPVSNFILSFVLLLVVGMFHHDVPEGFQGPAVVDYVQSGSTAAQAGIAPGDTIVGFADQSNVDWQAVVERTALNPNRSVPVRFMHNGSIQTGSLSVPAADAKRSSFDFDVMGMIPRIQQQPVAVQQVQPDTPASRAGLTSGDQIRSIDSLQPHSVESLLAYMKDAQGKPSVLSVLRNGNSVSLNITPELGDIGNGQKAYHLGFRPVRPPVTFDRLSLPAATRFSWTQNKRTSLLIVDVLHGMFARRVSVRSLSGPVGIFQEVDTASQIGVWTVLELMASISLNLGIFNLLPFPILDGGLILFLAIESVLRRDLNHVWKERIYQGAFVLLLVFTVFVIFNDVSKMAFFQHTH